LAVLGVVIGLAAADQGETTLEARTLAVASELRCPVCQNLSVADSPSRLAQQMRATIQGQLRSGWSPDQVRDYFVARYGEWILLEPRASGLGLLPWVAPPAALAVGALAVGVLLRRRRQEPVQEVTEADREAIARELASFEEPE
jgi:cytochrome c-type biogenesis protein CcmH